MEIRIYLGTERRTVVDRLVARDLIHPLNAREAVWQYDITSGRGAQIFAPHFSICNKTERGIMTGRIPLDPITQDLEETLTLVTPTMFEFDIWWAREHRMVKKELEWNALLPMHRSVLQYTTAHLDQAQADALSPFLWTLQRDPLYVMIFDGTHEQIIYGRNPMTRNTVAGKSAVADFFRAHRTDRTRLISTTNTNE